MLLSVLLTLTSASAFATTINCQKQSTLNRVEKKICKKVIDSNKLQTINCNEPEDGYTLNICKNARNKFTGQALNCLEPQDGAEINLCSSVVKRDSVSIVNCLGNLEDGYEIQLCSQVSSSEQKELWNQVKW